MADTEALRRLVLRNMGISAAINAGFSLGFFLLVFGSPARPLAFAAPDRLALDFLPQSGMVALMSALVPPLIERKTVAAITGGAPRPAGAIFRAAMIWALLALVFGGLAAGAALLSPVTALGGGTALALKLVYGAGLGAMITALALRQC